VRGALVLVVVAGCGGGHAPATSPVGNEGELPTTLAACPSSDDLLRDLRRLQSTVPAQSNASIDDCVPGRFGRPGWIVAARTESDELDATRYVFVLGTDHEMIAAFPSQAIDFRSDASPIVFEVADLDGDGVDEVLATMAHTESGHEEQWVYIYVLGEDGIRSWAGFPVIYEDDATRCEASYEVVPGGIRVTTRVVFGDGEPCLPRGETLLEMRTGLTPHYPPS
jgi:hypothetical protein